MGAELTKKMGPLPVWAWGLIVGAGALFVYRRMSASSSSTTPTAIDGDGSNAIDPADPSASGGDDPGGDTTGSGAQTTTTPTDEFGDFLTFMGEWSQVAQSMGWVPPGSTGGDGTTPPDTTVPPETINVVIPAPSVPSTPLHPSAKLPPKVVKRTIAGVNKVTKAAGGTKPIPTIKVAPKKPATTKPPAKAAPKPKAKAKAGKR